MSELNKEDLNREKEASLAQKDRWSFLYSLVMLVGGVPVYKYLLPGRVGDSLLELLAAAFIFQLGCIALGFVLKLLRRIFKKKDEKLFSKAFWLDTVEEGFSIWVLLVIAFLVNILR